MRAVICRAWGEVDSLRVEDVAPPAPAADEVLIDVRATAVNYADSIMVAERYQTRPPFPFSPGIETAPLRGHPQSREKFSDHRGIVQGGDQTQPALTMRARQDVDCEGRHVLTPRGSESALPRKRPARDLDQAAW